MKLAAQLYTVRDFTKTDGEVRETLTRVREIGYEAVQISGFNAYNPENIAKGLKENGLEVCATHTPLDRILNETDKVIEEHKLFGAKYVGLGYYESNDLNDYKELLKKLSVVFDKFNAADLKFLYHNHSHEFEKFDGIRPIDLIIDEAKRGRMGLLPDLYWVQTSGESPERFLRQCKGLTPVVHFKDMRVPIDKSKSNMAEVFEGNMDYESIYKTCEKLGVEWVAVEQDWCDGNPFDSLKKSYTNLKNRGLFIKG